MPKLGMTASGRMATESYRPTLIDFSFAVSIPRVGLASNAAGIPLPQGWSSDIDHKQLLVEPSASSFAEFRAAFGFVASIKDTDSTETDSPFLFTVVLKLFFKYGDGETKYIKRCFVYSH